MITKWTSHLPEADKAQFKNQILGSKTVLERLQQILKEDEGYLNTAEMNPKIYDTPNWDYKQAHGNGYRAALHMVCRILDLKDAQNEQSVRPEQPRTNA